jgi:DNA ligase (NAD+)
VIVSRASLHNFQFARSILEADVIDDVDGKTNYGVNNGTSVMISRAGDVIPQVMRRIKSEHETSLVLDKDDYISLLTPPKCPACGADTFFDVISNVRTGSKNETVEEIDLEGCNTTNITSTPSSLGQVLRCGGPQLLCPPRAIGALSHAYSREGLNIVGLSEGRLQQLMNASLIEVPADLFQILDADSTMKDEICKIPLWGEKSVKNLIDSTQNVATNGVSLSKFIYSLGIRHVGVHSSKLISSAYGSVSNFFHDIDQVGAVDITIEVNNTMGEGMSAFTILTGDDDSEGSEGVKGVGPVMIDSLIKFSSNKELVDAAKQLAERVPVHDEYVPSLTGIAQEENVDKPFSQKSVVFTGSVGENITRSAAKRLAIEVLGAKSTPGSISKSTGVVVEGIGGGQKAEKARALGIDIIDAEEFLRLVEVQKAKLGPESK